MVELCNVLNIRNILKIEVEKGLKSILNPPFEISLLQIEYYWPGRAKRYLVGGLVDGELKKLGPLPFGGGQQIFSGKQKIFSKM
jgi:hypothetical protein